MTDLNIPSDLAQLKVGDLTPDQLAVLLEATAGDGIRISFSGKQLARRGARQVRPRTMDTIKRLCWGTPEEQARNFLIEGDNLQGMATLYKYRGQVDFILTDPPYNTGNDFRYNDRWEEDPNDEGMGDFVALDDGALHTKWLKFMWPRLVMMKAMLKPGGVLAICIDQRELFRLGQMLDEMFDQRNRLAIINWQKASAPKNDQSHVASTTEYVLIYAKEEGLARTGRVPRAEDSFTRYKDWDGDPKGPWREHDLTARTSVKKDQYGIQSPFTGTIHYPSGTRSWAHPKRNIQQWLEEWGVKYLERDIGDGRPKALMVERGTAVNSETQSETERLRTLSGTVPAAVRKKAERRLAAKNWPFVWFGLDGQGGPRPKKHLVGIQKGFVPTTYWARDEDEDPLELGSNSWEWEQSGLSQSGVKELTAVVGPGHGFETVKPLQLCTKLIQIWCPNNGMVLDPFSGSGTTGHAVQWLNVHSEAERRFILIEQGAPEKGDPYARTLTFNRLKRAFSGNWATGKKEPLGGGFTYKRLSGKIDGAAVLRMERAEMRDTVIFSHYDEGRRRRDNLQPIDPDLADAYRYLVAVNADNEGCFLVWDGPDKNTDLTREVYTAIVEEAKAQKLKLGRYHVYARRWIYQRKTTSFNQIPDRILASFGLDVRNEPFSDEDLS